MPTPSPWTPTETRSVFIIVNIALRPLLGSPTSQPVESSKLIWQVADAFIKLRIAKAGLYDYETPPRRGDYEAIEPEAAQRVVRFMKVRRTAKAG